MAPLIFASFLSSLLFVRAGLVQGALFVEREGSQSYKGLPCPSREEFRSLTKGVDFVGELKGELEERDCQEGSKKGKLAKLIKFMSTLEVPLPRNWQGGGDLVLRNPLSYLLKRVEKVGTDRLGHDKYTAYIENKRNLYLGGKFFDLWPMKALLVLVHEARHLYPRDKPHVECVIGKKAQITLGCDRWFNVRPEAGAYSYAVSFAFGLARHGRGLSSVERNSLLSLALTSLGNDFASIPHFLALPIETLVVLGEDGLLYYLHPFLKRPIPYFYGGQLDLAKIKFDRETGGLYLITEGGEVYVAKPFSRGTKYKTSLMPKGTPIRDIALLSWDRARRDRGDNLAAVHFIDGDNKIWQIFFDGREQRWNSFSYGFPTPEGEGMEFAQLTQAHSSRWRATRYVLSKGGKLYRLEGDALVESGFQDPKGRGWRFLGSGKSHVDIFGVNRAGELFLRRKGKRIEISDFQVDDSRLYLETIGLRAQADGRGRLFVKGHEEKGEVFEFDLSRNGTEVKGVSFIRSFLPSQIFELPEKISWNIRKSCGAFKKVGMDPWTNLAMGLDKRGRLLFQTSPQSCEALPLEHRVKDYTFSGTIVTYAGDFSKVFLELTFENGLKKRIRPYQL